MDCCVNFVCNKNYTVDLDAKGPNNAYYHVALASVPNETVTAIFKYQGFWRSCFWKSIT